MLKRKQKRALNVYKAIRVFARFNGEWVEDVGRVCVDGSRKNVNSMIKESTSSFELPSSFN